MMMMMMMMMRRVVERVRGGHATPGAVDEPIVFIDATRGHWRHEYHMVIAHVMQMVRAEMVLVVTAIVEAVGALDERARGLGEQLESKVGLDTLLPLGVPRVPLTTHRVGAGDRGWWWWW